MKLNIIDATPHKIAEVIADDIVVNTAQEALDIMTEAGYYGADSLILHETHLHPDFFNLRSGLAGEVLLKFTNYRMKLAVIGDFEKYESDSLKAFMRESNRGRQVFFVADRDAAVVKLTV